MIKLIWSCAWRFGGMAGGFLLLFVYLASGRGADGPSCPQHLPYGEIALRAEADTQLLCHDGYAVLYDFDWYEPRLVAEVLTREDTLGCVTRTGAFHADELLPADRRATPKDYTGSGYDRGHMRPAADGARSMKLMKETFAMTNMAPQAPMLNRARWAQLEEYQRRAAFARGALAIYTGTVIPRRHATIGADHIAVPSGFFKVLIDLHTRDTLAFMAPNKAAPKGKDAALEPWLTSLADVEESAGLALALPDGIDKAAVGELWPADARAWKRAKQAACARS